MAATSSLQLVRTRDAPWRQRSSQRSYQAARGFKATLPSRTTRHGGGGDSSPSRPAAPGWRRLSPRAPPPPAAALPPAAWLRRRQSGTGGGRERGKVEERLKNRRKEENIPLGYRSWSGEGRSASSGQVDEGPRYAASTWTWPESGQLSSAAAASSTQPPNSHPQAPAPCASTHSDAPAAGPALPASAAAPPPQTGRKRGGGAPAGAGRGCRWWGRRICGGKKGTERDGENAQKSWRVQLVQDTFVCRSSDAGPPMPSTRPPHSHPSLPPTQPASQPHFSAASAAAFCCCSSCCAASPGACAAGAGCSLGLPVRGSISRPSSSRMSGGGSLVTGLGAAAAAAAAAPAAAAAAPGLPSCRRWQRAGTGGQGERQRLNNKTHTQQAGQQGRRREKQATSVPHQRASPHRDPCLFQLLRKLLLLLQRQLCLLQLLQVDAQLLGCGGSTGSGCRRRSGGSGGGGAIGRLHARSLGALWPGAISVLRFALLHRSLPKRAAARRWCGTGDSPTPLLD